MKIRIKIPKGTKIYVEGTINFIPRIIKQELKVTVLFDDGKYNFKLPKSTKHAYVDKDKVEIIVSKNKIITPEKFSNMCDIIARI